MRILIAGDNHDTSQRIRDIFGRQGLECPGSYSVPLELAADRASRLMPDVLVIVLPDDPAAGLAALHETRSTVPNVYTLVVGPATNPQLILRALHEGGDEFLDETVLESELAGALGRFKTREALPRKRQKSGRVIAVLGPSGGCGSSTVAANIAVVLAKQHAECGLVDLRLSANDLASMLDLKPSRTLAEVCDHLARLDQSMFEQFLTRHSSGVALLAAAGRHADVARVTNKGIRRTLAMARVRFPYVVVDLDNTFSDAQVEALWQSDVILLVLRLDYTSVRNTRRVLDSLTELGVGIERVRLVANQYRQRKQLPVRQAQEALGMPIASYIPNDPAAINQAINKGIPVVLHRPSAKVSRKLQDLGMSVNGQCPVHELEQGEVQ